MCGRYSAELKAANLKKGFGVAKTHVGLNARYNIAPSQDAPVVIEDKGRLLELYRWGLVPAWAKDPAIGYKMINARAETIGEKPSFKRPFEKNRCLVLADGFFEWRRDPGGKKTPHRVVLKSREPFAMAGLWDTWKKPDGSPLRSFTIITTEASEKLRTLHERMPVILSSEGQDIWLDPKSEPAKLQSLLKPFSGEQLEFFEVSPLVNKPENDRPEILEPVARLMEQEELF